MHILYPFFWRKKKLNRDISRFLQKTNKQMEIDRWKNLILSQSYRTKIKGLFLSETFWRLCRILILWLVTSSKLQAILKSLEWAHRLCSYFGGFAYKASLFVLHESLQAVSQTSMTVMKVTVRDTETITFRRNVQWLKGRGVTVWQCWCLTVLNGKPGVHNVEDNK